MGRFVTNLNLIVIAKCIHNSLNQNIHVRIIKRSVIAYCIESHKDRFSSKIVSGLLLVTNRLCLKMFKVYFKFFD